MIHQNLYVKVQFTRNKPVNLTDLDGWTLFLTFSLNTVYPQRQVKISDPNYIYPPATKAVYCLGGHADRHFIRYAGTQKTEFTFYEIVKFKNPSSMKMYGNVKFCVCHPRICICVTSPKFTALELSTKRRKNWKRFSHGGKSENFWMETLPL